jgi:DNA-binding transcriptional ArsR family regulator
MRRATTTRSRTAVDELESLFKALADKTRLRILALLGKN